MSLHRELSVRLFGPLLSRRHRPTMSTLLISGLSALPTIPTVWAPVPTQAQPDSIKSKTITVHAGNPAAAAPTLDLRPDERERVLEIVGRNPRRG
jgi:hypothetical protein